MGVQHFVGNDSSSISVMVMRSHVMVQMEGVSMDVKSGLRCQVAGGDDVLVPV